MNHRRIFAGGIMAALALGLLLGLSGRAGAQDNGYHIGETAQPTQDPNQQQPSDSSGPVRMARFSYVKGNVTWRPDATSDWTPASNNTPMRQGAQVWVGDGARGEIQFDDGSILRLGSGGVATLQTLYSDSQGEFTEIKLTDGLSSMDLRTDHSIYQIDTPHGTVKAVGPSVIRVGVDEDVEIGVRDGSATLEGAQGKLDLHAGDYVDVKDDTTPFEIRDLPKGDSWDQFSDQRHDLMTHDDQNLPENMRYVAGDLDSYGTWQDDSEYGSVWCPRVSGDWRPYYYGHWVWVDPFGWTWVSDEPWGWAPYHWGTWIHRGPRWCWVPGPVYQYWSPAVVSFSYYQGSVCWSPLAPAEVHYPARFSVGFYSGNWGLFFSIGACGTYYAYNDHWCVARPWNSYWVNHWHERFDEHRFDGGGENEWAEHHFVPSNARFGGACAATVEGFRGRGGFVAINGQVGERAFTQGRTLGAPAGNMPVAGPVHTAPPTQGSWSPSRISSPQPRNTSVLQRPVYRGSGVPGQSSPGAFGGRIGSSGGSPASDAAEAARRSLGWPSRNSGGGRDSQGGGGGFGGAGAGAGGRQSNSPGGRGTSRKGGWSVPDHGGWTHSHSTSNSNSRGGGSKDTKKGGG